MFITQLIKKYTAESTLNSLKDIDGSRIFDEPLVGFVDGDDPIFTEYKKIIGDFHLTPREVLEMYLQSKNVTTKTKRVSVISFIMPATDETRISNRRETKVTSLRWNHTRWQGQDFINELSKNLVLELERLGHNAVAPELTNFFKVNGSILASNWSQRHIAYAAGLGTFSLSDGFITAKGIAIRCGSVVTDAVIKPTPRLYKNHVASCLFYQDKACRRCIERCPTGAITEQGHDKQKCLDYLNKSRDLAKQMGRTEVYIGRYAGCGLCQTKVPCEAGIPKATSA
jgi:epoxyqueuosine reductase